MDLCNSDSKESACNARDLKFDPWVGKMLWRREWQPTPVLEPGKSHGQRSLMNYSSWGHKRVGHNLAVKQQHNSWPTGAGIHFLFASLKVRNKVS